MKDAFTAAYSELIRHQVELSSTLDTVLTAAEHHGRTVEAGALREELEQFNLRVAALAHHLSARDVEEWRESGESEAHAL
jgi:hypothetical protein